MRNPGLMAISVIDIVVGILIIFGIGQGNNYVLFLFIVSLLKGSFSVVSSFSEGFYFDIFGALDFVAGVVLMLIFFGIGFPSLWIVGVLMLLKGLYSFFS